MDSPLLSYSSRTSPDFYQLKPIARWSPARGVWETDKVCTFCEQREPFAETWPREATIQNSLLYEHPKSGHRTDGSGSFSLLLKTPTAQLAVNGGSQHPDKRTAGGHGPTLADQVEHLLPTPNATDRKGSNTPGGRLRDNRGKMIDRHDGGRTSRSGERIGEKLLGGIVKDLLPTPNTMDDLPPKTREQIKKHRDEGRGGDRNLREYVLYELPSLPAEDSPRVESRWGKYEQAILRWQEVLGREAPSPTEPGRDGKPRLSPVFTEWLMALPPGWVTDAGISRKAQLHCLGNGVVVPQVTLAIRLLLDRMQE